MTAYRTPLTRAQHAVLGLLIGVALGLAALAFVLVPLLLKGRCW